LNMFKQVWERLKIWQGTVSRTEYLYVGLLFSAVKVLIDYATVTFLFGRQWSLLVYVTSRFSVFAAPHTWIANPSSRAEILTIGAVAAPFMYVGVLYSVKRLRDAGAPAWLAALFFVPFVKFLLIALLCILPTVEIRPERREGQRPTSLGRFIPASKIGSAILGFLVTAMIAVPTAWLITERLGNYGWTLFLGLPFFCGFTSAAIYCYHAPRTSSQCLLVALASLGVIAMLVLIFAIEGVICLAMAAPLAIPMALIGGKLAHVLQAERGESLLAFSLLLFGLPGFAGIEHARPLEPHLLKVTSVAEIQAPPETVWKNVVTFSELPAPTEAIFKTGLAYPLRAEISGSGVGAERHCVFSTGAFVEPITVWQEPSLLRFNVAQEPPPMLELSPFKIHPRHLDHYFAAQQGEFRLTALPGGRTRLEGTTWYRLQFAPEVYWKLWSDGIVHRIHMRVLNHIKNLSEQASLEAE
jgi:uncharacterized membrane protein YhaH (DUF805 family)